MPPPETSPVQGKRNRLEMRIIKASDLFEGKTEGRQEGIPPNKDLNLVNFRRRGEAFRKKINATFNLSI